MYYVKYIGFAMQISTSGQRSFHFIVIYFLLLLKDSIHRGGQIGCTSGSNSKPGRGDSTGGETFCFGLLVSLVMSLLRPYLRVLCYFAQGFACSLFHAYY